MNTDRIRRWGFRGAQLAALFGMALLGIFDVATSSLWTPGSDIQEIEALWRVGLAVATAAVWLPARTTGSRQLPALAMLLATVSLSTTVLTGVFVDGYDGNEPWGTAETAGLLGVVYVVARRAAARTAVWTVGALGLALAALPARGLQAEGALILGLFLTLCAAGVGAAGMYFRLAANARDRALDAVRAEQRAEFARDLHDFIAHHVTGIVVQAQGARFVAEQDPQRVITALEQIEKAGAETMTSMRRMVGVLRDENASPNAPLAPLAGIAELGPLLEGFAGSGPPKPMLHVDGELDDLPVEVSTSAYRVVMEALTNVRRHAAGASVVDVWLRRTPDWLLVRVANDGYAARTTPTRDGGGYGLVGLDERVRAVGGRITAGPGVDGEGWIVDAALPLNREVAT
jgi:signal transduction histidine kinase